MDNRVRWIVKVSKDTDLTVRSFLAQRGMEKGGLSKFIGQAVQKAVFSQTVADVQARNADISDSEIEASIDDTLRKVRAEIWGALRAKKRTRKSAKRA